MWREPVPRANRDTTRSVVHRAPLRLVLARDSPPTVIAATRTAYEPFPAYRIPDEKSAGDSAAGASGTTLGKGLSEGEADNGLTAARLSAHSIECGNRPKTGVIDDVTDIGCGPDREVRVSQRRHRQERTVEDVLEFHPHLQVSPLFDPEGSCEAHRFGRLPLPAEVIVERRTRCPGSRRGIDEGRRVENPIGLRVEALAIRVLQEQRLSCQIPVICPAAAEGRGPPRQLGREEIQRYR